MPPRISRITLWLGALLCFAGALALLIAAGLPQRAPYSGQVLSDGQIIAPEIGAFAPDFSAPTLDGQVQLTKLHGQPAIVNFWATWCVPCRVEMPKLQAFHEAHPNVNVLAVNLGERRDLVVDWVRRLKLNFAIVLDADGSIAGEYRLRGQPSTYVISPDGVITSIFYGPTTRQVLESVLEPFLRN